MVALVDEFVQQIRNCIWKRNGKYLVAEVDGFLGQDTLEFVVRDDIVTYKSMANKVQYVYPFTMPLGDFGA